MSGSLQLDSGTGINYSQITGKICSWLALISAFLYYPFEHLYSYHAAIGNLPRFMDGVFGGFALLCTALFILLFLLGDAQRLKKPVALFVFLFIILMLNIFCWVLAHQFLSPGPTGSDMLFDYYIRMLLDYIFLFFVGFYVKPGKWNKVFLICFVFICINTIFHINWDRFMIDLRQVIDPAYKGIYLRLSTTALFCGLFAWSTIKNTFFRLAVLLVMIPLLFFMGSRADFVTFLVILPVALWLTLKPAAQLMVYLFGGIFLTGAVATVGLDALKASRHFEIFNVEQFGSLLARNEMFLWGMERVANSPLFGDYGGTLAARGTIGSYIHNFLSVWQAFGLLPFLLFLTLMVLVVSVAIALLFKKGQHTIGKPSCWWC